MGEDADRIDTWAEIENAIARKVEQRLAAEMLDVGLAALRAREYAADAVRLICAELGGKDIYIPKLARHHRQQRDTLLRGGFNGDCADTAKQADLSIRHTRRIIRPRKKK